MTLSRRGLITGLVSLVAAPAIVRVASLMPVKVMEVEEYGVSPLISTGALRELYQANTITLLEFRKEIMREWVRDSLFYAGPQWTPREIAKLSAS